MVGGPDNSWEMAPVHQAWGQLLGEVCSSLSDQWFSTSLTLRALNTVPHVVVDRHPQP